MIATWYETSLLTLLSQYKLKDIYSADKFGIFYQCLPNITFHLKSNKCSSGKYNKIIITGLAVANVVTDKLPMFVIGKSQDPQFCKNVRSLPCRYWSQRESWMNSAWFEEWIHELDGKFLRENRKIALIIDNCPAHPTIGKLSDLG